MSSPAASFFFAANAKPLRKHIDQQFYVRSVVDLSNVPVFGKVGTYTILLILQKRGKHSFEKRPTVVAQVRALVGQALQACLDGRLVSNKYFSVFEVPEEEFKRPEWYFLPPKASNIRKQIESFPNISDFMEIKQGIVTGQDSVFIRKASTVAKRERSIYLKLLRDRVIGMYDIPRTIPELVFYPYLRNQELGEGVLREQFPATWKYLVSHRQALENRYAVQNRNLPWWRPETPRAPENLLRRKVVCPHLMLTPRFAVDAKGNVAVSRAPFFIPKDRTEELFLLNYFCGILNSSPAFWYISTYSFRYGGGYNRLEVGTLRKIPVPDPTRIAANLLDHFVELVKLAHEGTERTKIELEIDQLACEFYGFQPEIFSIEEL